MENNEVKITEARYKQLIESERREVILMQILMKLAITNAQRFVSFLDGYAVANEAIMWLENHWKVPFKAWTGTIVKHEIMGYTASNDVVHEMADGINNIFLGTLPNETTS